MKNIENISNEYDNMYSQMVINNPNIIKNNYPTNRYEFAILHAGQGNKILDIGMGEGEVLFSLKNNYKEFCGLELSNNRIKKATLLCKNMNTSFYNKSIEDKEIVSTINNVDTIICLDVIDHIVDVRQSLINMYCMLNENGKLILTLPNIARINRRISLLFGKFPSTSTSNEGLERLGHSGLLDGGKLHYFTFRSMTALLSEIGFKKIKKYGIGKHSMIYNTYPELLSGSISLVCIK